MSLAYTAPTWEDGSGTGISASQLQAISNCIEGLVQGSDKAVHNVSINGSNITLIFADGTQETYPTINFKGIVSITKTDTSGLVDTYTITYTDGSTDTFTVTNGENSPGDGQLTINQNGVQKATFTANQSTSETANITTDEWFGTSGTVSNGSVTFTGVDDSAGTNGYELFVNVTSSSTNKNPSSQISTLSGEGTSNMSITFTTDADNGATCKLRIIK